MAHYLHSAVQHTRSFLAPPPVHSWFQRGATLDFLNEDLALTACGIAFLFVVDELVVKRFVVPKARYFALHAIGNAVAAVAAFPDVLRALTMNPVDGFGSPASTMVPNSMVAAVHLYHCIAFPLRREDIVHHLAFVLVLCGVAVPLKRVAGVASGWGCFFLSGLPGLLNYLLLVASAHGVITKSTEKLWTSRVNVWLRGPSMTVYFFLAFTNFVHRGSRDIHPLVSLPVGLLYFFNGQYYTQQSVESLVAHRERVKAANREGDGDEEALKQAKERAANRCTR